MSVVAEVLRLVCDSALAQFRGRAALVLENPALRQQLAIYARTQPRPRIADRDRVFWVALARLWSGWRKALAVVRAETVVRWHRAGFRYFWRYKSRRPGRPSTRASVVALIKRMATDNPTWGAPRIHAELRKLGFKTAERTVSRYIQKQRTRGPSNRQCQSWQAFLRNHRDVIAAMDFAVVPTATFQILYLWFAIGPDRRTILHFGVTAHPNAAWVAQSLREAFPFDTPRRYLISDNDPLFQGQVPTTLRSFGTTPKKTPPRSPWQNGVAERWVDVRSRVRHRAVMSSAYPVSAACTTDTSARQLDGRAAVFVVRPMVPRRTPSTSATGWRDAPRIGAGGPFCAENYLVIQCALAMHPRAEHRLPGGRSPWIPFLAKHTLVSEIRWAHPCDARIDRRG